MAHEDLRREQAVEGSSDRSFSLMLAGVFLLIAAWPLLDSGEPRWWAAALAAASGLAAWLKPTVLGGANRLWIKLGVLMSRLVAPIALLVLFYLVISPMGLLMRLAGKDPMRLKRDANATSYWTPRSPPGPPPDSMTSQF